MAFEQGNKAHDPEFCSSHIEITANFGLTDGEPFGCLEQSMMHPWVDFVISNIKLTYILLLCMRIPFFLLYSPVIATVKMVKEYIGSKKTLRDKVDRRLALENPRPDLVQTMLAERQGLVCHSTLTQRIQELADLEILF